MRINLVALIALVFATSAYAWNSWTKDDYEIFDLVAALETSEGKGTSFYSFLGVTPSATSAQINKSYRKRSLELHPDKNPGVPDIQQRFARLGVVAQILRDAEKRERYNFFYKNGVPTWKGFGYAYTRWRPGMGFVAVFLTIVSSAMQYVALRMNHTKDSKRIKYFTETARRATRGASGRRKVRVPMMEGAIGGETLELVVDGEDVYLPHADGSATHLDYLTAPPTVTSTWPFTLARSAVYKVTGKPVVDPNEVEDFKVPASDDDQPQVKSAPRRGRAAELRKQRVNGSRESSAVGTATPGTPDLTENETGDEESEDVGSETVEPEAARQRKKGPGKANAARRRKIANKK